MFLRSRIMPWTMIFRSSKPRSINSLVSKIVRKCAIRPCSQSHPCAVSIPLQVSVFTMSVLKMAALILNWQRALFKLRQSHQLWQVSHKNSKALCNQICSKLSTDTKQWLHGMKLRTMPLRVISQFTSNLILQTLYQLVPVTEYSKILTKINWTETKWTNKFIQKRIKFCKVHTLKILRRQRRWHHKL